MRSRPQPPIGSATLRGRVPSPMSPAYVAAIPAFLAAAWAASGLRSPGEPRPLVPASMRAVAVSAAVIVGIVPGTVAASPSPSGQQVMTVDLGWAPSSNIPWIDLTQIDLFNLATEAGPNLDKSNI